MKRFFYFILTMLVVNACYDDTQLWEKLNDHEERLKKLEELSQKMNSDIESLHELVSAIEAGDYITDIRSYREGGVDVGYEISFADHKSIVIYHGRDGKDGSSVQGGNVVVPVIGVKEDSDGVLYWTVGSDWLLDEDGNKVKAAGKDGKDGTDGQDGKDGEDGITPKFKIEDDYWYVSYEDGADGSWQRMGKAVGEAGADGADGEDGSDGISGSPLFESVDVSDDGMYVTFTLVSGDVFQVPTLEMIEELAQALGDLAEACLVMNDNIKALSEIVRALQNNVYVTSVTKIVENGEEIGYTLEFSDGTSATICHGKDGEDGEDGKDGSGSTPEIGVRQDTDGVYYWTVNGEWLLDDAGQKVAASGSGTQGGQGPQGDPGKDGVTPKLKIENDYWYVSYDEGQTWEELGKATGEDGADGENGADGNDGQDGVSGGACMFSDVRVTDDAVVLVLADGTEIVLPRTQMDQSVLGLSQQSFYLRYEATKALQLTAEGIEEYCVMSKPDGWRASLDGTTLNISSPTKKAVAAGAAELSGEIIIHATTQAGKCRTAKVDVEAGPGIVLDVDANGNLVVENSYYGEVSSGWGEPQFGFESVAIGIAASSGFLSDPKSYIENVNQYMLPEGDGYTYVYNYNDWNDSQFTYVEGEKETDILTGTVSELYGYVSGYELQYGSDLIVWAAPIDDSGYRISAADVVYVEYVHLAHDVKATAVTHSDIILSVNCAGADKYAVGCVEKFSEFWGTGEEEILALWQTWRDGWGTMGEVEISAEDLGSEISMSGIMGRYLKYGTEYMVWVMPMFEGKSPSEYDYNKNFMPYVIEVKTNEVLSGGDHTVNYSLSGRDYSSIKVDVSFSDDVESVYYQWYEKAEFDAFNGDSDALLSELLGSISMLTSSQTLSWYGSYGESYILASVAVGKDGFYGEVVHQEFTTLEIPYDSGITVALVEKGGVWGTPEVTVEVTGADKVAGWLAYGESEFYEESFALQVCKYGHKASYSAYQFVDVVDGKAVLTFSRGSDAKRYYYVAAYNVEDDLVSGICDKILKIDLDQ